MEEKKNPSTSEPEIKVPCEVYSRIVGYLRPIQNWNQGKAQEFADRKMFDISEVISGNKSAAQQTGAQTS